MKKKIGKIGGIEGFYPNLYSVVINRKLANNHINNNFSVPDDNLFEYAKKVEIRYKQIFNKEGNDEEKETD